MKQIIALAILLGVGLLYAYSRSRAAVRSPDNRRQSVGVGFEELPRTSAGARRFRIGFADRDDATPILFDLEYTPMAIPSGEVAAMLKGTLTHQSDAPPEAFLAALAEVHGVPVPSHDVPRVREMRIDLALFGEALHLGQGKQLIAGMFTSDTVGPWMVAKLFLPYTSPPSPGEEAEEHSEIFLALNLEEGYGVLFPKADEYADGVIRAFAALLTP